MGANVKKGNRTASYPLEPLINLPHIVAPCEFRFYRKGCSLLFDTMTDEAPVYEQDWIRQALQGQYAATGAYDLNGSMEWALDGLIPRTGASVWFGQGATGKTQLLLWMSLAFASVGEAAPTHWLGAPLARRGQILVLSAEDTHEHILMRLGSLARSMFPDQPEAARLACSRVHVMSFLSMTEREFPQEAPTLFTRNGKRGWEPHERLKGIRHFIEEHNRYKVEAGNVDDQIVGVVMDSATSMAGFESTDSDGVTNLFFYLNRMCRRADIFWAVIGHTQKAPAVEASRPRENSVARLRGSAMWSTAPRMVVEVRLACDRRPKSGASENSPIKKLYPSALPRDMLVVDVAKANVPLNNPEPRYLIRDEDGYFVDISSEVAELPKPKDQLDQVGSLARSLTEAEAEDLRTKAVAEFISQAIGNAVGTRVVRERLHELLPRFSAQIEHLNDVTETRGRADNPRPKSLGVYLNRLVELKALAKKGKTLTVLDLDRGNPLDARVAA